MSHLNTPYTLGAVDKWFSKVVILIYIFTHNVLELSLLCIFLNACIAKVQKLFPIFWMWNGISFKFVFCWLLVRLSIFPVYWPFAFPLLWATYPELLPIFCWLPTGCRNSSYIWISCQLHKVSSIFFLKWQSFHYVDRALSLQKILCQHCQINSLLFCDLSFLQLFKNPLPWENKNRLLHVFFWNL